MDAIVLPFLGSRDEDYISFQYLPLELSSQGAQIAIPDWVVNRELLKTGDVINFHLSLLVKDSIYNCGTISWSSRDQSLNTQLYGITLHQTAGFQLPAFISDKALGVAVHLSGYRSFRELLAQVVKDCYLLKRGVAIYLGHLIPYFSRISGFPQHEYPRLKSSVLEEIKQRVITHSDWLLGFCHKLEQPGEITEMIELEELRTAVESELYLELFRITFESQTPLAYLLSIKELEKKLYNNFNTIVAIYIQSI